MSGLNRFNFRKTFLQTTTLLALIFFGLSESKAQYVFDHKDCSVRVKDYEEEMAIYLMDKAKSLLKERNFSLSPMLDNKRVLPGELYFEIEVVRPRAKLFTACIVIARIKKAERSFPGPLDKSIFEKTIKRSVPRITIGGKERCRLALKEAFVHIPTCQKTGP